MTAPTGYGLYKPVDGSRVLDSSISLDITIPIQHTRDTTAIAHLASSHTLPPYYLCAVPLYIHTLAQDDSYRGEFSLYPPAVRRSRG